MRRPTHPRGVAGGMTKGILMARALVLAAVAALAIACGPTGVQAQQQQPKLPDLREPGV